MYCLDTDILIDFLRNNEKAVLKIKEISEKGKIFTTPINLCELFKGAYLSSKVTKELNIIYSLIWSLEVLEFREDICREFGIEYGYLKEIGKMIQEFDIIIACFAKINNLTLVTRNKKHFENIDIKLEVWWLR